MAVVALLAMALTPALGGGNVGIPHVVDQSKLNPVFDQYANLITSAPVAHCCGPLPAGPAALQCNMPVFSACAAAAAHPDTVP